MTATTIARAAAGRSRARKPRATAPRETVIMHQMIASLGYRRDFLCWRQNTGAMRRKKASGGEAVIKFGVNGQSDIVGVGPRGRFVAIEVKRPGEKATDHQDKYRDLVRSRGGCYILATCIEELNALLDLEFPTPTEATAAITVLDVASATATASTVVDAIVLASPSPKISAIAQRAYANVTDQRASTVRLRFASAVDRLRTVV